MGSPKTKTAKRGTIVNHNYTRKSKNPAGFKSFEEFYPFYLGEHSHQTNRRLHLIGSTISILLLLLGLFTGKYIFILLGIVQGYAWAWVGHFCFEKNKPATFEYPVYSVRKYIIAEYFYSKIKAIQLCNFLLMNIFYYYSFWETSRCYGKFILESARSKYLNYLKNTYIYISISNLD